jgi:hypothetical protein
VKLLSKQILPEDAHKFAFTMNGITKKIVSGELFDGSQNCAISSG